MAVARTPNTRANFGRATRLPNLRLRVFRVGRTILIMNNARDLFAIMLCVKRGGSRLMRAYSKCQTLLSRIRVGFGASR